MQVSSFKSRRHWSCLDQLSAGLALVMHTVAISIAVTITYPVLATKPGFADLASRWPRKPHVTAVPLRRRAHPRDFTAVHGQLLAVLHVRLARSNGPSQALAQRKSAATGVLATVFEGRRPTRPPLWWWRALGWGWQQVAAAAACGASRAWGHRQQVVSSSRRRPSALCLRRPVRGGALGLPACWRRGWRLLLQQQRSSAAAATAQQQAQAQHQGPVQELGAIYLLWRDVPARGAPPQPPGLHARLAACTAFLARSLERYVQHIILPR